MADDNKQAKFKISLSGTDLSVLLYNVSEAAKNADVGFEDSRFTLKQFIAKLAPKKYFIDPRLVESALWSCNLLDELRLFKSPTGETFNQFVTRVLRQSSDKIYFDKDYNQIKVKSRPVRKVVIGSGAGPVLPGESEKDVE